MRTAPERVLPRNFRTGKAKPAPVRDDDGSAAVPATVVFQETMPEPAGC